MEQSNMKISASAFVDKEVKVALDSLLNQVEENFKINSELFNSEQPKTSGWRSPICIDSDSDSENEEEYEVVFLSDADSEKEFDHIVKITKQNKESWKNYIRKFNPDVHFDPEYYQLPPIENLQIYIDEDVEIESFGIVSQHIDFIVVVKPHPSRPQLDLDSSLLDKNRNVIGKIFEVFGPVAEPFYSIRFNSADEVNRLPVGSELYFAPKMDALTKKVFADDLFKKKWSDPNTEIYDDASKDDPDFSDDESEQRYLSKQRQQKTAAGTSKQMEHQRPPAKKSCSNNRIFSQPTPFNTSRFFYPRPFYQQPLPYNSTSQYGFFNNNYPVQPTNHQYRYSSSGHTDFFQLRFPSQSQPQLPRANCPYTSYPPIVDTRYIPR